MTIREHIQRYSLGAKVVLFEIDMTQFDLGIAYMTPTTDGQGSAISFGGQSYYPHPIQSEGYELSAGGSLPRPSLVVANLDNSFTALVEQSDDLHGAKVTRIQTYERYLDTGSDADGNAHKPLDVFFISVKTEHTRRQIAWTLAAATDLDGVSIPARTVVRDWCGHETRFWDTTTASFDYTNVTCPYVGAPKDADGNPCAAVDEVFSKRLGTCCKARFGENAVLPTRAFPGVSRLKVR